jgi:hypothetical protein
VWLLKSVSILSQGKANISHSRVDHCTIDFFDVIFKRKLSCDVFPGDGGDSVSSGACLIAS